MSVSKDREWCRWCGAWCWEASSLLGAWQRHWGGRSSHAPLAWVADLWRWSYLPFLWQDLPEEVQSGDSCAHTHWWKAFPVSSLSISSQPLLPSEVSCQETPYWKGASHLMHHQWIPHVIVKEASSCFCGMADLIKIQPENVGWFLGGNVPCLILGLPWWRRCEWQ